MSDTKLSSTASNTIAAQAPELQQNGLNPCVDHQFAPERDEVAATPPHGLATTSDPAPDPATDGRTQRPVRETFAARTAWRLEPTRFAQALENQRRSGAELFDLTASNPTTCGFAYPEQEILAALADPRALIYRPESKGLREAREAVAEYYRGRPAFASVESQHVHAGPARAENTPANLVPAPGDAATPARTAGEAQNPAHPPGIAITTIDPENIVLTSGTSEGYSYIFRLLCEPGDEILVPAPSYPLFEFLADLADVRLVPYPLLYDHGWQIDFDGLRAALTSRARAVLVVHPNNPTGSYVKAREAAELAEMCASRGLAIVADEVFLDYPALARISAARAFGDRSSVHEARDAGLRLEPARGNSPSENVGERTSESVSEIGSGSAGESSHQNTIGTGADAAMPRTFAFGSDALTFTLSGISKISALPQMKLAWIVVGGPQQLVSAAMERLEIMADTFLSAGAPAQVALARFLEMRGGLQSQLQQRVAANLAFLDALLANEPGPLERLAREAGWYAVLRIPSSRPDADYAVELLERCAVLVHPGQFFNFSQEGFLVLSLIAPEEQFREGARRLHQFFAAATR